MVKNYKTKSLEVLVQTADFKLHNVSQKGEFKWSIQLDTLLIPEAFEIDFYKNGKLQYLLATKKSVYLLDRLGRHVEGFPFQMPNKKVINSFSLFDYDKNLKYRILLSDNTGAFYLFDKKGANLKGWDPLKLSSGALEAPRHLRVRGRDFILAALDSGEVHLLNRKGEEERGFPVVLGERLVPGAFMDLKNSLSASIVSVLTASGKVESFNLNGDIGDEQLWLEGEGLEMLLDASGDGYALKGVISGKTMIGQQDLSDLCELEATDKNVQYYIFGDRNAVVVSGGKSKTLQMYVDNKNVMPEDLKASQEVGVLYSSRKNIFQIYIVINKQLRLVQLNGLK